MLESPLGNLTKFVGSMAPRRRYFIRTAGNLGHECKPRPTEAQTALDDGFYKFHDDQRLLCVVYLPFTRKN